MNVISKELVILSYRQTVGEKGQVRGKKEKNRKKKEPCDNVLKGTTWSECSFYFFNPFISHNPHWNFTALSVPAVGAGGCPALLLAHNRKPTAEPCSGETSHWGMGSGAFLSADTRWPQCRKKERTLADPSQKNIITKHILVVVLVPIF